MEKYNNNTVKGKPQYRFSDYPIEGKYGPFGGSFIPEILRPAVDELEVAYERCRRDNDFLRELNRLNKDFGGRPSPLYLAKRLSDFVGNVDIYLKREDLIHGGAHKFNNVIGQTLIAKYLDKKRIIAETGAGQHGVATAIAGAVLGIEVEIYMGEIDMQRQKSNVERMELMGAKVIPVRSGSKTLKDAVNEALRDWIASVDTTHYLIGSVVGPHPFPYIVREFQSVIGYEIKQQCQEKFQGLPDMVIACVGGGSNAAGTFYPMIDDNVELVGVEAGGIGDQLGDNGATLIQGRPGILHGSYSYVIQDSNGQIINTHSISAGLDYPGVGPEHSFWKETDRVSYRKVSDAEAVNAFKLLSRLEGIIPALESAHAIAEGLKLSKKDENPERIIITLSGRGDKDIQTIIQGENNHAC